MVNPLLYIAVVFWETAHCNDFELCILLIRVRMRRSNYEVCMSMLIGFFFHINLSIFNTRRLAKCCRWDLGLIQGFYCSKKDDSVVHFWKLKKPRKMSQETRGSFGSMGDSPKEYYEFIGEISQKIRESIDPYSSVPKTWKHQVWSYNMS